MILSFSVPLIIAYMLLDSEAVNDTSKQKLTIILDI